MLVIFMITLLGEFRKGAALFRREGCSNCHRFNGQGGSYGPDLTNVSRRRSFIWIMEQIKNSKTHNPNSKMPDHSYLSNNELLALALYLQT